MSWPIVKIGDVADVLPGFAFKSKELGDEGAALVKIGNIQDGGNVDLSNCQRLPKSHYLKKHDKFRLKNDDIVIAMTGATAGKIGRVKAAEDEELLLNQRVAKFSPRTVDPDFLWFVIGNEKYRAKFYSLGGGAAQPNMSGPQIAAVEIPLPDLPTQERIAAILSSYDDLIENNRRRIALLEQAARLLYREWFVHFRFPGHETAKFVDGLPEGWERRTLGDLLTLKRGYDLPHAQRKNGDVPVVSSSGFTGFHNEKKAVGPGIVTGRYGTLGEVYLVEGDFWPLNTALYVSDKKGNPPLYLLNALQQLLGKTQSEKAAVPGVNRNVLHAMRTEVPPHKLRQTFEDVASPLYSQRTALKAQAEKLTRARGLLLPRLMDGRIPV